MNGLDFRIIATAVLLGSAMPAAQDALVPGSTLEFTLAPQEQRQYVLRAPEARFMRLTVVQETAPCQVTLTGPNLAPVVYASRDFSQIGLAQILVNQGEYHILVRLDAGMTRSGTCALRLEEFRTVNRTDEASVAAYRDFWNSYVSHAGYGNAGAAVDEFRKSAAAFQVSGDMQGQAASLLMLAHGEWQDGKRAESAIHFTEALTINRSLGDSLGEGLALVGLMLPDGSADEGELRSALARASDWVSARVLDELSNLWIGPGNLDRSVEYRRKAVASYKSVGDRAGLAKSLGRLGDLEASNGNIDAAITALSEAAEIYAGLHDSGWHVNVLLRLARVLEVSPMDAQAELDLLRHATAEAQQSGLQPLRTAALERTAGVYRRMGDDRGALDILLGISELEKGRQIRADLLPEIASAREALGEDREATRLRRQVAQEFRDGMQPDASPVDWWRLSRYYLDAGDLTGAKSAAEESRRRQMNSPIRQNDAPILLNLATIAEQSGDLKAGLDYGEKAIASAGQYITNPGPLSAYPSTLAGQYLLAGDMASALKYARAALDLSTKAGNRQLSADMLLIIAKCQMAASEADAARESAGKLLDAVEQVRAAVLNNELRASYFAKIGAYYDFVIRLLMESDLKQPHAGFAAKALETSERARARLFLEQLNEGRADIKAGVEPEVLRRKAVLERSLAAKAGFETDLLARPHSPAQAEEAARQVRMISAELHNVEADIRTHSPRYAALTQPRLLTVEEIQSRVLDPETVLLEYWLGDRKSYVWAVSTDHVQSFELPPRTVVNSRAREFYDLLTARSRSVVETAEQRRKRLDAADAKLRTTGAALSHLLLGPAVDAIRGKRLAVVRSEVLQLVPFAALPDPQYADLPLVAKHEVVALPSASVLAEIRELTKGRPQPRELVAVLADPVFDAADPRVRLGVNTPSTPPPLIAALERSGMAATLMHRLPSSRAEANAIAKVAPPGSAWKILDFDASRTAATNPKLAEYRFVHFASHAVVNSDLPELSGIVLSLVDQHGAAQNGFLRLQDVYNLNLPAELVALSACQTALGKDVPGEGLIGLSRGFLYAGAKRVASSLWKVDDAATARLMESFYRDIFRSGLSPVAALRQAQIEMSRQPLWRSPYYWAAFELQGEWR
jgi:CHAT domain-containing protein/tetratricopeptide (TPR) repeat protein